MTQFVQERPRLLYILSVKSFGKPVIDFWQQVVSFSTFALLVPQVRETGRRA